MLSVAQASLRQNIYHLMAAQAQEQYKSKLKTVTFNLLQTKTNIENC